MTFGWAEILPAIIILFLIAPLSNQFIPRLSAIRVVHSSSIKILLWLVRITVLPLSLYDIKKLASATSSESGITCDPLYLALSSSHHN